MEAAFLTSLGGLIGIALGAGIGWAVHLVSGFPISLPWWSFAIGLGFSASVGIFFGIIRRSRPRGSTRSKRCATDKSAGPCTKKARDPFGVAGFRTSNFLILILNF